MKYKDWSDFAVDCSCINEVMSLPKSARPLTTKQRAILDKLLPKDELTDRELETIAILEAKENRAANPELSVTAIKYLQRRYAWEKYNRKTVPLGFAHAAASKGNELEAEAIQVLSKIDRVKYGKCLELVSNGFIKGKCDVCNTSKNKILEVKTMWSITTFLPYLTAPLDRKYWLQMQGYLELYNANVGEVCFVLLNTPPHLIDREKAKYTEKYVFGEIDREKYDEEMEKLSLAYDYNKIPIKRRIIRFEIARCPEIMPKIYQRVEKCREWLNNFELIHLNNPKMAALPEFYVNTKENNTESDTTDACEND